VRTVTVDGVRIAAEVVGGGPPALVLHGFTGDHTTMGGLVDVLAAHRTVVAVDLVGHGASDAPADTRHYEADALVTQLAGLLSSVGPEPADLVGYSLGGRIALTLAARRPEKVAGLVAIGASPGLAGPAAADRRRSDCTLADALEADGVEAFVDSWMALPMWDSLRERLGPEAWETSRRQRLGSNPVGLANNLRGFGTGAMPPLHDDLPSVTAPTLLVVGEEDTKFRRIADEMRRALPSARMTVIGEAGHAAHLEQPDATHAAILDHLGCA